MNRRSFLRGLASLATTAAFGLGFSRREIVIKISRRLESDHRGYVIGNEFEIGRIVRISTFKED